MSVSLSGAQIWRPEANKNICHRLLLLKASSRLLRAHKHLCENLFSYKDCSDCKISADKSPFEPS